jgi:hypothetical protein
MRTIRVPDERRFVHAIAKAVDPGDSLSLLKGIGAVTRPDMAVVRHTRQTLASAHDRASDLSVLDQTHTIAVLLDTLSQPDAAAYLAYHARGNRCAAWSTGYAEALAVVGCASDTLGSRRRPWEILTDALCLPERRQPVAKFLSALPCSPAISTSEHVPSSSPHHAEAGP